MHGAPAVRSANRARLPPAGGRASVTKGGIIVGAGGGQGEGRFLRTHALPRCGTPKRPQYPFTPGGYCGRGGRHTGRHRTLSLRWPDAAPNPVSHHPASPVSSFLSPTRRPPIDALLSSENQQQQQQQGRAAKRR